eukprot:m.310586 g.310586  ORF g.310586 m.310586 type:complete len:208 (-) comp20212_c0_seq2:75-698(-)
MLQAPSPPNTRVVVGALGDKHLHGPRALMRNKHEWRACVVATGGAYEVMDGYFMTLPDRTTYHMGLHGRHGGGRWQPVDGVVLPPFTFVCGEVVQERPRAAWEDRGARPPRDRRTLYIRDAMLVGGLDVRRKPFEERLQFIKLFAEAIDRDARVTPPPVHVPGGQRMSVRAATVLTVDRCDWFGWGAEECTTALCYCIAPIIYVFSL